MWTSAKFFLSISVCLWNLKYGNLNDWIHTSDTHILLENICKHDSNVFCRPINALLTHVVTGYNRYCIFLLHHLNALTLTVRCRGKRQMLLAVFYWWFGWLSMVAMLYFHLSPLSSPAFENNTAYIYYIEWVWVWWLSDFQFGIENVLMMEEEEEEEKKT